MNHTRKRIAIVGAGMTGLAAAYDLAADGHDVTIFEAASTAGGVASGFQDERWEWPLERFYHHLFTSDKHIIHLAEELGIEDRLFFPRPLTSVYYNGRIVPFDSVRAWFAYPAFNFWDTLRFGAVSAFLRYTRLWRLLERTTADKWMRRWYGARIYEATWRPALINKFGQYYDQVNMAWMWARIYVRSQRLGYIKGGFQALVDRLVEAVAQRGAKLRLNTPVAHIDQFNSGLRLTTAAGEESYYDQCLVTTSPKLLLRFAPMLEDHEAYTQKLRQLTSIGAVVVTAALRWPLMKNTYWLNLPADSAAKIDQEIPFLALVEHTNYIDKIHYGGDHILYMGDYVPTDHPYFSLSDEELSERFLTALHKFNPNFDKSWVRQTWVFRAAYAQPVPFVKQSKVIPELQTPMSGLYFASMSQVYPWDRGTNYAVEIGRRVARLMQAEERS